MEKLELLLETLKGSNASYPLYSLWKHFPYDDRDPHKLSEAHLRFYERHEFDLMKISPHGRYPVVDFGCLVAEEYDQITGSTRCKECSMKSTNDWETIEPLNVAEGEFGKQLETVKLIHKNLEDLPKMMTVFTPLMVASKMDINLLSNIRSEPELMKEAFFILTEVMTDFALSSIDEGAQGIFLASQHLQKTDFSWREIGVFELSFTKKLLNDIKNKVEFIVLHVHGQDLYFKETIENLSVNALNWHDQLTWPSIEESLDIFKGGLLAGIDETKTLVD
jgi:uroporphyrinogen decarboxylase